MQAVGLLSEFGGYIVVLIVAIVAILILSRFTRATWIGSMLIKFAILAVGLYILGVLPEEPMTMEVALKNALILLVAITTITWILVKMMQRERT